MTRAANVADDATARVCRARVLDLLRQGWTAKSLAAGGGITPETVGNVVAGRPVSWRTCDVVAAVFEALDGSLRRYQERVNRRQGARVQTLNRMAQLQQMERVRTGYRWGVSVEALAVEYGMPVERVRLIVGDAPAPRPSRLLSHRPVGRRAS